ncbi:MAG: ABC-2 family transporter protein [Firmicutes bacterium]|nr:ABC-2 family transporter protein [Bacillota bacterium]
MNKAKKYLPFFRASMMNMFIYRGTIWLWMLVDVFQFAMMVFLWKSVYQFNDVISGFTFKEMLVYFLLTNVFFVFTEVDAVFAMSEEIKEGRISLYLVKPISYKVRLFAETLGRAISVLLIMLPIAFGMGLVLTLIFDIVWTITIVQVLVAVLYLPLIFFLMFEFSFFFGTLVIHTSNEFGLVIFMSVFTRVVSGQLIPLSFYPQFLFNIVEYIPFRFISYPPLILLDKVSIHDAFIGLIILAAWVVGFKIINYFVYKASIKKMVVFGG